MTTQMVDLYNYAPTQPAVVNGQISNRTVVNMKAVSTAQGVSTYLFSADISYPFGNQVYDFRAGYPYPLSGPLLVQLQNLGLVTAA